MWNCHVVRFYYFSTFFIYNSRAFLTVIPEPEWALGQSPMRPKAEWAIDSEAMRARGAIVLVKSN